jgi:hypothetical protein
VLHCHPFPLRAQEALEIVVQHLVVEKNTPIRDLLHVRQTCKHFSEFVGDFVTTLKFTRRDLDGHVSGSEDDDGNFVLQYPYPMEFRLRRISTVAFGGLYEGFDVSYLGRSLAFAARRWNWTVKVVEVYVIDSDKTEPPDYSSYGCDGEAAAAFVQELHELHALELSIGRDVEFVRDTGDPHIPGTLRALTRAPVGLRSLTIYGVLQFDAAVSTLAAAPPSFWNTLEKLEVTQDFPAPCPVADLLQAAAPHLKKLRELSMVFCDIDTHGASLLQKAPALRELRSLRLVCSSFLSMEATKHFFHAMRRCELLEEVRLDAGDVDGSALLEMLGGLRHIRVLALKGTDRCPSVFGEEIARLVVDWPQLETVYLDNELGLEAARILGSATRLSRLRTLSIVFRNTPASRRCVEILLGGDAPWMDTVKELYLDFYEAERDEEGENDEICEGVVRAVIRAAPHLRRSLVVLGISSRCGFGSRMVSEETMSELRLSLPTAYFRSHLFLEWEDY